MAQMMASSDGSTTTNYGVDGKKSTNEPVEEGC